MEGLVTNVYFLSSVLYALPVVRSSTVNGLIKASLWREPSLAIPSYLHLVKERNQCIQFIFPVQVSKAILLQLMILLTRYIADCNVNYHNNFYIQGNQRIYYNTIPDHLQVGEHHFAERKLVNLWISLMLVSWWVVLFCQHFSTLTEHL